MSFGRLCEDISLILKKEAVKKCTLIGSSGEITLEFALLFPKKVDRLVVVSTSYATSLKALRPSFILINMILVMLNALTWIFYRKPKKNI